MAGMSLSVRAAPPAIITEELPPVKVHPEGSRPAAAAVAELIDFPRVQLDGDPDPPVGLADQFDRLGHPIFEVVKDSGLAAVVGEFPVRCGASEILTVIIHYEHFDRNAILHRREHRMKGARWPVGC